jgi:hypothetical protein
VGAIWQNRAARPRKVRRSPAKRPKLVNVFQKPPGERVDSARAVTAAVAAGMKTQKCCMKMSPTLSQRAERFMSDRDFSSKIDAATGKFHKKKEDWTGGCGQ